MRKILFGTSFCLIFISGWLALTVAAVEPIERNIIYVHVPASICALLCFCGLFLGSVQYLRTRGLGWDRTAAACGEVGSEGNRLSGIAAVGVICVLPF